ncbi:MAG TPA: hypothetical protein PKL31_16230 [Fulvivirga sp.]|nr:hypothetical protein [Fulvivirga sp.]
MDVIKRTADQFSDEFREYGSSLEKIDGELSSKLLYINKTGEKLRFLSYLNDIAEKKYKEHAPKCKDPETCGTNRYLENCLYAIRQQYDDYLEIEGASTFVEKPAMKFFNQGQYFDAFSAIKEIISNASISIILIDGYVDSNTLSLLPAKSPDVKMQILTTKKWDSPDFKRAVELYNKQYQNLQIFYSKDYHDRFLIIDNKDFYHFGASLKDAGNKAFMFSKIEDFEIQNLLMARLRKELK